jgi:4-hydroxy-3-methylbut-2-enyl diphosphate reductase
MPAQQPHQRLKVRLAAPRGFCAGVERAIRTVEETLALHGAPVYVRHEIVHNKHVVDRLAAMGAIFIDEIDAMPDCDRPLIFSAHGAPRQAHADAKARNILTIDATCPLVLKVHAETRRHVENNRHVYLVGHANHPEVIGTMGQAPRGAVTLIQTAADVERLDARDGPKAYVTQTTLSVDDARVVVNALERKFPEIVGPKKEDICYATANRQAAVKSTAPGCDLFVVMGSPTSSNSARLVEVAKNAGAAQTMLVEDDAGFDFDLLKDVETIGVSAGASAPERLVEDFLKALAQRRRLIIEPVETVKENVVFNTPLLLAS